jgi:PIN domain nuclease of toxin-antitoxin system
MDYILDTHTFLWFITDNDNLTQKAKKIIENSSSKIFLSSAVAWEISIKISIGKIILNTGLENFILKAIQQYRFIPMPITISHAVRVNKLRDIHKDPFDRILIAQSIIEKAPLITSDRMIRKYNIKTVW